MKKFKVYKHTNKNNGKSYIGLTKEVVRVYETLKDAAVDNNVSKSAVCMCCTGRTNLCAGFEWRKI